MDKHQVIALVPMRHHSQRVPQKNFRDLAGKPLFHHILMTLMKCNEISKIVVDTDSPVISADINRTFPQVTVIDRPEHLRADDIPMNDILIYDTSQVDADLFLQTHSTNPLLRPETVSRAIRDFTEQNPVQHDSLFSVTAMKTRLWDRFTKPSIMTLNPPANTGSAACVRRKFMYLFVLGPEPDQAAQPDW